jgi:hypothetical protein
MCTYSEGANQVANKCTVRNPKGTSTCTLAGLELTILNRRQQWSAEIFRGPLLTSTLGANFDPQG